MNILIDVVDRKLSAYTPETENMPFHFRLIGKDKYVLFSFIQSINTTFGMSIWEQVAEILARGKGYKVRRQVDVVNGELRGCKEQGKGRRFIYKKMRDFKEFKALKRKILTWQAIRLTGDIERTPLGIVAIPYNPYHPEPYNRWTLKGLYDIENDEILIAEEFWDFVAGERVFDKLLKVFEEAGRVIKPKIDEFLKKFNKP